MCVHCRLVVYALYAYDSCKKIGVNRALWHLLFVIPDIILEKRPEKCPTASKISEFAGLVIVPARDYPYGNRIGPYGHIGRTERIAYFLPALPTFFPKRTAWENHFVSFFYHSCKANINSTFTLVSSSLPTYCTYVVRSVSETPVNEYMDYAFQSKR